MEFTGKVCSLGSWPEVVSVITGIRAVVSVRGVHVLTA